MDDTTLIITAWFRPYYLTRTLASWAAVPEFGQLGRVAVALGHSARENDQRAVILAAAARAGRHIEIWPDSPAAGQVRGEHRALGEAIGRAFGEGAGFVIASSEDVIVSDDVLRYFAWCRETLPAAWVINAHNELGQGWHTWHDDSAASQSAVCLTRGAFNPWCWMTRADWWNHELEPGWDWDASSGAAVTEHGWDWQMHRLLAGQLTVTPAASRALNIGEIEGVYAHAEDYRKTRAESFRARRGTVDYRLTDGCQDA